MNVKFQTRACEWLFFSEEGQWMVVRSSKAARLIMVILYLQIFGDFEYFYVSFLIEPSKQIAATLGFLGHQPYKC